MSSSGAPSSDWELSKENFQPLKSGRKASHLSQRPAGLQDKATKETQE